MATAESVSRTSTRARPADATESSRSTPAQDAAASASAQNSIRVEIPGIGQVCLPPLDQIAFLGGIATLTVLNLIEWPVAAVLAVGHVLAHNRHHAVLRDFGEALDKA